MDDVAPTDADRVKVVQLPPRIDVSSAMRVRAAQEAALRAGITVLIADLAATTALSLEGLQALALARAAAVRRGAELRLAALQPSVLHFMNLTGTARMFPLYDTVSQARSAPPDEPPRSPSLA